MITGGKPRNTVGSAVIRRGGAPLEWDIRWAKETGSTNEDAYVLGKNGAPAGIVCAAESQTAGRGRLDRTWFSPPGAGLYCSVLLRPSLSPENANLLSFCAALAMTDALRAAGLPVMVKWPNDIVYENRKLCGILSACSCSGCCLSFAVIGSGLNLRSCSYPEELRLRAASLEDFGIFCNRDQLLLDYLNALSSYVGTLEKKGFEPLRVQLEKVCVSLSHAVRVSGGQQAEGTAEGIGSHGELLLRQQDGSLLPVTFGDVSVR